MSLTEKLNIGDIEPFSIVDFPSHIAAVAFLQGCPWRCPFCYNTSLQPLKTKEQLEWTFENCTGLVSVAIGDGITNISFNAFLGCSNITSITIPASVTKIGDGAFYGCNSLTTVYYTGTEQQWKAMAISGYNDPLARATTVYSG